MKDPRNAIYFSSVSAMEIRTKVRIGKLFLGSELENSLAAAVEQSDWLALPLSIGAAQLGGKMEWDHRDPFDRLLSAQAIEQRLILLSSDAIFSGIPSLKVRW